MPRVSCLDPTVTPGVADTRPEAGQRPVIRRGRCAEDTAADAADAAITPMYRAGYSYRTASMGFSRAALTAG